MKLLKSFNDIDHDQYHYEKLYLICKPKDWQLKKELNYIFDAMDFVYQDFRKRNKNKNIDLILTSIEKKLRKSLCRKNDDENTNFLVEILLNSVKKWHTFDIGKPYLYLDNSRILNNYTFELPLFYFKKIEFIFPNLYKTYKNSYYTSELYLFKFQDIMVCQRSIYTQNDQLKQLMEWNIYVKNILEKTNNKNQIKFTKSIEQFLNKEFKSLYINQTSWIGYKNNILEKNKNINTLDLGTIREVLDAFTEVDSKRHDNVRQYLQNFYKNESLGKFGLPQAKWRNGTYGIRSKEPDFFWKKD